MINRIQLLRNTGQFDSVNGGGAPALAKLTLVYAENGRGKTTLASILRSLGTGDPLHIAERRRLGAAHAPHIVIDCVGGAPAVFQNNAWSRSLTNVAIFDDAFVEQNVYSGLTVGSEHRQNLNELILGAQGVQLNRTLQGHVAQIEAHNTALRLKAALIPAAERGALSVDDFCDLPANADIDAAILTAERNLTAAQQQERIRNTALFQVLDLPALDPQALDTLLRRALPAVEAQAAAAVQAHLGTLGAGGEAWVADGLNRAHAHPPAEGAQPTCPYCAQDLRGSALVDHYRIYFGEAYHQLKDDVAAMLLEIGRVHGGQTASQFERAIRVWVEQRQFWSQFTDAPEIEIDTAAVGAAWRAATDAVRTALEAKKAAPLEPLALSPEAHAAITAYDGHRQTVRALSDRFQTINAAIRIVQEQAAAGNPAALASDVARLKATKARHSAATAPLCADYLTEKTAKTATEQLRDQARTALGQYQQATYPAYNAAINTYLARFNAGFRISDMGSVNTRSGPACTYNIVINAAPVAVAGGAPVAGAHAFRNTLSSGDRNSLALAFFFASLDQDANLAGKIIVIDDPMTSLDEHRALTTAQEVRRLIGRTAQVIVLSHSKPFLCRVWEHTDAAQRVSLEVARDAVGSTIRPWDINQDCITEYDRRHSLLRQHVAGGGVNSREVAESIRPVLEGYLRVACPEHFPPGTLLGPFRGLCDQRVGGAQQILDQANIDELRDLVEYANRFHHDTNPAWQTQAINDGELVGFVNRALAFVRH
ncbi:MAG TPA: AAA family ATPase [Elusimicrobiota bacterium]|nr:AAA family ATPase [Elusimicrobiota bacterium]